MTSSAVATVETPPDLKPNESCRSSAVGCLVIVARHHGMHLTGPQVIRDNFLADEELSTSELVRCAKRAGLATKVVKLDWPGLGHLHRLLPAIVRLKNGNCLILRRLELDDDHPHVVLEEPMPAKRGFCWSTAPGSRTPGAGKSFFSNAITTSPMRRSPSAWE